MEQIFGFGHELYADKGCELKSIVMQIAKPSLKNGQCGKLFLTSAAGLLVVTAIGKLLSVLGEAAVLQRPDPIFAIVSSRQMLFLAASLELGVAAFVLVSGSTPKSKIKAVFWLGTVFFLYRAGLWALGYGVACSCLGEIGGAIGLTSEMSSRLMLVALGYLLIPSGLLWWRLGGDEDQNAVGADA